MGERDDFSSGVPADSPSECPRCHCASSWRARAHWMEAVFAFEGRARNELEKAMIVAAALTIDEKCEVGPYWAGHVAAEALDAMKAVFSEGLDRSHRLG